MQVAVSEAELKAIHRLPKHVKVKHQAWLMAAAGTLATLLTLGALASTAYFGHFVLLYYRSIWWEYGFGAGFSLLSLIFTGLLSHDIRNLQDPFQLLLDIVRLQFCSLAASALLVMLYCKIRVLDPETVFNLGCQSGCQGKYVWFRLGPIIVGCVTLTLALIQLVLFVLMFRNPLVNPPLIPQPSSFAPNAPLLHGNEPISAHDPYGDEEDEYELETRMQVSTERIERRRYGGRNPGLGDGRMRFGSSGPGGLNMDQYELGRM